MPVPSSWHRRAGIAAVLALGVTLLVPAVSYAEPPSPDDPIVIDSSYDQAVEDAKAAEQAKALEIAGIEQQLVQLQIDLENAQIEAQARGEDYVAAQIALEEAIKKADDAAAQLTAAEEARDLAHSELGSLAAQMFKSNTQDPRLEALLSANGLEEVLARTEAFDIAGSQADRIVQRYKATTLIAEAVKKRADEAQAAMEVAEAQAKEAFEIAEAAAQAAETAVADAAATRLRLLNQLAALKQTTLQAEQDRQDAIDAERKRREEEAARQEALRQEQLRLEQLRLEQERLEQERLEQQRLEEERRLEQQRLEQEQAQANQPAPAPAPAPAPEPPKKVNNPKPPLTGGSSSTNASQGEAAVAWALAQVGKRYVLGASGPDAFDCSGLTSQAWSAAGKWITRSSRSQYNAVMKISYNEMRPGDLVFWATDTSNPATIYHVAMYIGGGKIVEAARPGIPVRVTTMYYSGGAMPFAGRP